MPKLLSYDEVCDRTDINQRSLLTGNGFSIACNQSFDYRRLVDAADFGGSHRTRRIRELFDRTQTSDFESVVRRLEEAAETADLYPKGDRLAGRMKRDADTVRRGLARAVAHVHPPRIGDVGDVRLDQCNTFLRAFGQIFTVNYDALLHWARMRDPSSFDDGFRRRDQLLLHTAGDQQNIFWLHGALHLRDGGWLGGELSTLKVTWADNGPLIDYVRSAIALREYPLVVTEGTWMQKTLAIRRSPYLSWCLESLAATSGSLVTFGWGINPNDEHILAAIAGSQISELYLGIRHGSSAVEIAERRAAADILRARSGKRIAVHLWDTGSATVW